MSGSYCKCVGSGGFGRLSPGYSAGLLAESARHVDDYFAFVELLPRVREAQPLLAVSRAWSFPNRSRRPRPLISHRFSSVRNADRIYALQSGRVTEAGPHKELTELDGHYAELFQLQAAAYLAGDETSVNVDS